MIDNSFAVLSLSVMLKTSLSLNNVLALTIKSYLIVRLTVLVKCLLDVSMFIKDSSSVFGNKACNTADNRKVGNFPARDMAFRINFL